MTALGEFLEPPPVGAAVQVLVETRLERGVWGVEYAPAAPVWAWVDQTTSLVRTLDGEDVTSSAGVFVTVERGAALTLGSRVTLPGESRPRTIVTRSDRTQGEELGLPVHVEVRLA